MLLFAARTVLVIIGASIVEIAVFPFSVERIAVLKYLFKDLESPLFSRVLMPSVLPSREC